MSPSSSPPDLESLQSTWRTLYTTTLPSLARARDPAQQPKWPVTLDHCFARIILDNAVGRGVLRWDHVVARPAVKNMDKTQLVEAIELGESIAAGEVDLSELNAISLLIREKVKGGGGSVILEEEEWSENRKRKGEEYESASPEKRQRSTTATSTLPRQTKLSFAPTASPQKGETCLSSTPATSVKDTTIALPTKPAPSHCLEYGPTLHKIRTHPSLTPYRKRLYTVLLSVPRGRYTTYAAMSAHLNSSARAVGNGMRNNPFAPEVPCHRVLAADGSIGGFGGDWGKDGQHARKKIALLRSEGVRFDGRGKVVGEVFRAFDEFGDVG